MEGLPGDYRVFPDGRTEDLRYRFRGGTRLRVIAGPHQGATGTMDTVSFDIRERCPVVLNFSTGTSCTVEARLCEFVANHVTRFHR